MRLSILLMIFVILFSITWAKDLTTEEQRVLVRTALAAIAPDDETTLGAVETKLVENTDITSDTLRLIMNEKIVDLSALESDFDAALADKVVLRRIRMEIDILSSAVVNRDWKINPRKLVYDWLTTQKDTDGNTFDPESQPRIINSTITAKIFPDYVFFKITFTPYPTPRTLPTTVNEQNLFAVDKTGKVTYLPNPAELEKFFKSNTVPVKTDADAKNALNAWLLLSTQYSAHIALNFVNPKLDEIAVNTDAANITAAGKSNIMNVTSSVGTITATLTFDAATGKLTTVKEVRFFKRGVRYQISGVDGWY
ncbi:MAG: hypothetical protein WCO98_15385 [bacterium]